MTTKIMRTTTRIVVPIILIVAISLFLQGHNAPGGGFIGGVLTVAAFGLIYIAYSLDYLEEEVLNREVDSSRNIYDTRTVEVYRHLFVFGLVVIVASGTAALVFDVPFLSQTYEKFHLPLFGEIELATAVVFDLGIYCVVVGGLLSIFSVVGQE